MTRILVELPFTTVIWVGANALWFGLLSLIHVGFSLLLVLLLNIILVACALALRRQKSTENASTFFSQKRISLFEPPSSSA